MKNSCLIVTVLTLFCSCIKTSQNRYMLSNNKKKKLSIHQNDNEFINNLTNEIYEDKESLNKLKLDPQSWKNNVQIVHLNIIPKIRNGHLLTNRKTIIHYLNQNVSGRLVGPTPLVCPARYSLPYVPPRAGDGLGGPPYGWVSNEKNVGFPTIVFSWNRNPTYED